MPTEATPPLLLVVSGTSGAGKSSVVHRLLAQDGRFARAVTATTRAPRGDERDGVDYHFLTENDFRHRLVEGAFLEHANVYGRLYGTPKASVQAVFGQGKHCVLVVDIQGVQSLRAQAGTLTRRLRTVFVRTRNLAELARRLRARGEDDEQAIAHRLSAARAEEAQAKDFDLILVNDDLDRAAEQLRDFAVRA